MPSLTSELIVRLIDGVTKPARGAANALLGIGRAQDTVNKSSFGDRLVTAIDRNNAALDRWRGRMFDAVAAGYLLQRGLSAPINAATEFETLLEDIGQKADIPASKLGELGRKLRDVATETNQTVTTIGEAFDTLVGMGAAVDVATNAAAPIGQAATAYRAATQDLAAASYAAVQNLKVPSEQIGLAIDAMAKSGKEGAFELRDMAQYFPSLGASYQRFGQTGVEAVADLAAALQAVRKGTGDSASAATNLNNVLQKIYAPATVKAFNKLGVNLRKSMKDAAEAGLTPIEAIAEITNKALKGDLSKLPNLFQDAQVQAGLTALIQNMEEYRRIRAEALDSAGTVEEDYLRRIRTAAGLQLRWQAATQNLSIAIGQALVPAMHRLSDILLPVIERVTQWVDLHPELTANILGTVSALVALRIAVTALGFLGLVGRGGALSLLLLGFKGLSALVRPVAGFFQTLALRAGLATAAMGRAPGIFARIGDAAILLSRNLGGGGLMRVLAAAPKHPVLLAVLLAVGAAIKFVHDNWSGLTSAWSGFASSPAWAGVGEAFGKLGESLGGLGDAFGGFVNRLNIMPALESMPFFGPLFRLPQILSDIQGLLAVPWTLPITDEQWGQWGADVGTRFANGLALTIQDATNVVEAIKGLFSIDLYAIGVQLVQSLWNGVMAKLGEMGSWVQGQIAGMFGGGAPAAPSPPGPNAVINGVEDPGLPMPRAQGGPVIKGRSYRWGEYGRGEVFTAGQSGWITPFSKLPQPMSAGGKDGSSAPRVPTTYAPVFQIGDVYGVADFDAKIKEAERRMRRDFESMMAGTFSDQTVTA